jgi:hypothetical protein
MYNVAVTLGQLHRHADALNYWEKVLEFRRRVLPEDHPHIGKTYFHFSRICSIRSPRPQVTPLAVSQVLTATSGDTRSLYA